MTLRTGVHLIGTALAVMYVAIISQRGQWGDMDARGECGVICCGTESNDRSGNWARRGAANL